MSAQLLTGPSDSVLTTLVGPGTSCTAALPPNAAVSDILIAFVGTQTALTTGQIFTESSGTWTQLGPLYVLGSGKRPTGVWIKTVPNSAALAALTAPTFQSSAAGRWIVRIARITGADLTSAADGASTAYASGTTSVAMGTATTTRASSLVFAFVHGVNTSAQANPTWGAAPSGFTQAFADNVFPGGGNSNDSLYVAAKSQTAAGGSTATVTVSNAQTSLDGFQIAVKSSPGPFQTPHLSAFDGTLEKPAQMTVWDGSVEKPTVSVLTYPGDTTIASLFSKTPFFSAHRGGSASYPEETVYSYDQCTQMMMQALEISVWRSSDGVFVCSHDQNLSRVTGTSMDIPTNTWAAMSSLTVKPVGTDNQAQPARPLARIEDVLSKYGRTHVCFVEDKSGVNANALLTLLDSYGGPTRHIWKASGLFAVQAIVKAKGYKSWGYWFANSTSQADFANTYTPWDFIGLDFAMPDSEIAADIALAGKPTIGHIIATTAQRDRMLGLGCVGCMTSAVDLVFPH